VAHPLGHIACRVDGTAAGAGALAASVELWRDADGRQSLLHATGPGVCDRARRQAPDVIVAGAGAGRPPGPSAGGLVDGLLEGAPCAVLVVDRGPPR
jgi:nucleotide-binding universal stress UspA family protein